MITKYARMRCIGETVNRNRRSSILSMSSS